LDTTDLEEVVSPLKSLKPPHVLSKHRSINVSIGRSPVVKAPPLVTTFKRVLNPEEEEEDNVSTVGSALKNPFKGCLLQPKHSMFAQIGGHSIKKVERIMGKAVPVMPTVGEVIEMLSEKGPTARTKEDSQRLGLFFGAPFENVQKEMLNNLAMK
jgi:hypothetical protein